MTTPMSEGRRVHDDFIIIALDIDSLEREQETLAELSDAAFFKCGMELFYSAGEKAVSLIRESGKRVFLDLKINDIPKTVEKSVRALTKLKPDFLTVFTGLEGVQAAVEGAGDSGLKILNVTVLTSQDAAQGGRVEDLVLERARLTKEAGGHGVICSALETASVKAEFGNSFLTVNPGIRPANSQSSQGDDQKRVATPQMAFAWGADHVVIGRPIMQSPDRAAAYRQIMDSIE